MQDEFGKRSSVGHGEKKRRSQIGQDRVAAIVVVQCYETDAAVNRLFDQRKHKRFEHDTGSEEGVPHFFPAVPVFQMARKMEESGCRGDETPPEQFPP